jgi:hypothetical protein
MDVKWKFDYYPYGGWIDVEGNSVAVKMPFRAEHAGRKILVTPSGISTSPGHGEPAMSGVEPKYFDDATMEPVEIPSDDFITLETK